MPWREASLAGSSPSPPPIHHRPRYDFQSQVVLGDNTVIKPQRVAILNYVFKD
nr:hypothetical protein Iba_chr05aCG3870 [Ipomoea batatas]GMD01217.1 hypothetical protein Iba_chr05fCG5330 [Ipomoea batatas]